MSFKLTIKTGNAAFEGGDNPLEIARILRDVARRIEDGHDAGNVRDINGNLVGTYAGAGIKASKKETA